MASDSKQSLVEKLLALEDQGLPVNSRQVIADHPGSEAELSDYFATCEVLKESLGNGSVSVGTKRDRRTLPTETELLAAGLERLQRFNLLKSLGEGGWGTVYLVYDNKTHQEAAFKVPKDALHLSLEELQRFDSEGRMLEQLAHNNICQVYEAGVDAAGLPYLLMKYVKGRNLRRVIQGGDCSTLKKITVIKQVAAALAYVHSQTLIHRDVKPENIIVPEGEQAVLVDFGLAKCVAESDELRLTGPTERPGTWDYMAPEARSSAKVGTASDVYGLGVVLFELLTGALPNHRAGYAGCEPTFRSELLGHSSEFPDELVALCGSMLIRDPKERPEMSEVVHQLAVIENLVRQSPLSEIDAVTASVHDHQNSSQSEPSPAQTQEKTSSIAFKLLLIPMALIILAATVVISVRTPAGIVTLVVNEPDVQVTVDGQPAKTRITLIRDDQTWLEITAARGQRSLAITKPGFNVWAKELEIGTGKTKQVSVKLTPTSAQPEIPHSESFAFGEKFPNGEWGDILQTIAPSEHAIRGDWLRTSDGSLRCIPKAADCLILIPVTASGSYEMICEFSRKAGDEFFGVIVPVGASRCSVFVDGWGGTLHGVSKIDRKEVAVPPSRGLAESPQATMTSKSFSNHGRHVMRIGVTIEGNEASLDASLNGQPFAKWKGNPNRLSANQWDAIPGPGLFGLRAFRSTIVIHSLQLKVSSGEAFRLNERWATNLKSLTPFPPAQVARASEHVRFEDKRYHISDQLMSISEAQELAIRLGGTLWSPDSNLEAEFLAKGNKGRPLWTGFWRHSDGDRWRDGLNRVVDSELGKQIGGYTSQKADENYLRFSVQREMWSLSPSTRARTAHACIQWSEKSKSREEDL